jgi:hypothetical protein
MAAPTLRLSRDHARRVIVSAQRLVPGAQVSLTEALERASFVRTLGGVEAYLALRARVKGFTPALLHRAMQAGQVQVVPAVRGCMYLLSRAQVPGALRLAAALSRPRDEKVEAQAGVKKGELQELGRQVVQVLAEQGPLTTDALRKALPAGAVRSLGEAGKKRGVSSPLPPALRVLEFEGRVARLAEGGRLDSERYAWSVPAQSPFAGAKGAGDVSSLLAGAAETFLQAAGVGRVKDLAAWAGVAQRDAAAAVRAVGAVDVEVEGEEEGAARVALPAVLKAHGEAARADEALAFLPFEDNLLALQGTPALLADPRHHALALPSWDGKKKVALGEATHLAFRPLLAEGRLVGFWELDPAASAVVTGCFAPVSAATRKRLAAEAEVVAGFLMDELGHGRSFSLDTDAALDERARWIRSLGK